MNKIVELAGNSLISYLQYKFIIYQLYIQELLYVNAIFALVNIFINTIQYNVIMQGINFNQRPTS